MIDANVSWRLVNLLKSNFENVKHVDQTDLPKAATDLAIWTYAVKNNYHIITSDDDFYLLAMSKGVPPKIVLLKTGNQSTSYIANLILKHKNEILEFVRSGEFAVLEIY